MPGGIIIIPCDNDSSPPLQFQPDGTFTIVQFTDLHYRNGNRHDLRTIQLMREVLDFQPPDLVVLTGDVIDGGFCRDPLHAYASVAEPIIQRNLPWAAVFGNHDDEGSASREQLMAAMHKLPRCLSVSGPETVSGVGNYILTIDADDTPAARMFFLDSHAYADKKQRHYAWIRQDQIDWFLALPHDLPALVFLHIPLPEYDLAWSNAASSGGKNEPVCCPKFNSGFFNAIKTTGDVMGVFAGHDHTNDFCAKLAGVQLCYGRAGGFSTYGKRGFSRGARIIKLTRNLRTFETSVLRDGHLHHHSFEKQNRSDPGGREANRFPAPARLR